MASGKCTIFFGLERLWCYSSTTSLIDGRQNSRIGREYDVERRNKERCQLCVKPDTGHWHALKEANTKRPEAASIRKKKSSEFVYLTFSLSLKILFFFSSLDHHQNQLLVPLLLRIKRPRIQGSKPLCVMRQDSNKNDRIVEQQTIV